MKLFSELKRRNVFRVAVAYLVAIWLVIQVTGEVAPALGLPTWTSSMVVWLSIVGFPFMLIFAWMYELTPEGLRREERDSEKDDAGIPYSTPGLNMLITALLAVALVFVIVDSYVMTDHASGDPASQQAEPALPGPAIDANSIAVLPFTNMSEDDAQDYFSDGLAEELLNLLAQQRGLKVAARTSSFSFRNAQQDIRAIGDALDVATVLEGSVRKAGNRLRITAQLIDVSDGYHLWSETYDRELTDVFQVQDEIAAAIVQALSLHLDMPASVQQAPGNIEAYDLYLQGRHLSRRAEQASAEEALALYRRATEVDPSFAPAWAALGNEALALRESQFWDGIPEADAIAIAQDSIDRALALSPDLAEAHVTQSFLHWDRYRFEQALESSERAIAINPNLATAHAARARVLEAMGYIGDAWDALGKGIQLDPLDHDQMVKRVRLARGYLDDEHLARAKRAYVDALARQGAEGFKEESSYIDLLGGIRRSDEFARWYRKAYEMGAELEAERFIAILRLWRFDSPFIEKMRSPDAYRMYLTSWRNRPQQALQMYEELPEEIQAVPIVLEERSIAQMNAGDCPGALDSLYSAHGDTVRIYGQVVPAMMRSNSNLALNRAWCLRLTGKEDEAAALLERVDTYLARLRDSAVYSYFNVDAKFRLMHGDTGGALDSLEAAMVRNEVDFSVFADPVLRSLSGNPRFERLRSDLEAHVNAEREKLGWPAASL